MVTVINLSDKTTQTYEGESTRFQDRSKAFINAVKERTLYNYNVVSEHACAANIYLLQEDLETLNQDDELYLSGFMAKKGLYIDPTKS